MDNKNNAIKNPDSRKISDAMMRCLAKCIATFGIGLYVYAGEDVPSVDMPEEEAVDVEEMINAIMASPSLEQLREIYFATVKSARGNQDTMKQLEAAKDARKNQLTEGAVNE